jgi:C-terminal processing protease CtpA/Prc
VMAVTPGGAAAQEGTVQKNDQILKVDESDLRSATRTEAISVLKNTGHDVRLIVARKATHDPLLSTRL